LIDQIPIVDGPSFDGQNTFNKQSITGGIANRLIETVEQKKKAEKTRRKMMQDALEKKKYKNKSQQLDKKNSRPTPT